MYVRILKNRILPALCHLRLEQIQPLHIAAFLADTAKNGSRQDGKDGTLSSGTIQIVYRILKNVFNRSVEWNILKTNPVASVKTPKVTYKETEVYNEDEIKLMFEALEHEPFHWRMIITLALTTGLRRGELVGLEWKHIDLNQGTVYVKQSVTDFINGNPVVKVPKTKKSIRKISLSDAVCAQLGDYYAFALQKWSLLEQTRNQNHFFVFFNQYGQAYYPESPYLWFRSFLKKHQL